MSRRVGLVAAIVCAALIPTAAMARDVPGTGHSVIANIAAGMVTACAMGLRMKALRRPLILGYILAGVLICPIGARVIVDRTDVVTVSEIGLILLLFTIVALCTIPDPILRGTSNQNLMNTVRAVCPKAQIILTADSPSRAFDLYQAGADYVLQPSTVSGAALVPVVEQALHETLTALKDTAADELVRRNEILP